MILISFTARAERQTAIDAEKEAFKILSDIYSNKAEPLLIEEVRLVRDLVTTRMVEDAIPEDYMEDFIPEWYLYEDWSVKMVPGLWLKPKYHIYNNYFQQAIFELRFDKALLMLIKLKA